MKWYILKKDDAVPGIDSFRPFLKSDDLCIYAREYQSGKGYQAGQTNQLISNFKKYPSKKKETYQWQYREKAIKQFKEEIEYLLNISAKGSLTAIPSSKTKDHSDYDNRFEDLFKEFLQSNPGWLVEWPVEVKRTTKPVHISGKIRDPEFFKGNYIWKGFQNKEPEILYIFDDIITTGSHFRAMSDFLRENNYNNKIIGIFWAKTIKLL